MFYNRNIFTFFILLFLGALLLACSQATAPELEKQLSARVWAWQLEGKEFRFRARGKRVWVNAENLRLKVSLRESGAILRENGIIWGRCTWQQVEGDNIAILNRHEDEYAKLSQSAAGEISLVLDSSTLFLYSPNAESWVKKSFGREPVENNSLHATFESAVEYERDESVLLFSSPDAFQSSEIQIDLIAKRPFSETSLVLLSDRDLDLHTRLLSAACLSQQGNRVDVEDSLSSADVESL